MRTLQVPTPLKMSACMLAQLYAGAPSALEWSGAVFTNPPNSYTASPFLTGPVKVFAYNTSHSSTYTLSRCMAGLLLLLHPLRRPFV